MIHDRLTIAVPGAPPIALRALASGGPVADGTERDHRMRARPPGDR
jgi:hypothetical protein